MSWTKVGECSQCDAPIYSSSTWMGVFPPPIKYTCMCYKENAQYEIVTTMDTK